MDGSGGKMVKMWMPVEGSLQPQVNDSREKRPCSEVVVAICPLVIGILGATLRSLTIIIPKNVIHGVPW